MAEQVFSRATRAHLEDVARRIRPLMGTAEAWSLSSRGTDVAVQYDGDWGTLDTVAIAAQVTAAEEDTPAARAADGLDQDRKLKAIVLWIAQLHGKTAAQAKSELRAILNTL